MKTRRSDQPVARTATDAAGIRRTRRGPLRSQQSPIAAQPILRNILAKGESHPESSTMNIKPLLQHVWRDWIRPLALPLLLVASAKSAIADINYVPTGSM